MEQKGQFTDLYAMIAYVGGRRFFFFFFFFFAETKISIFIWVTKADCLFL